MMRMDKCDVDLPHMINGCNSSVASRWVLTPQPRPQALARLVCFHHAGGTASTFAPWAAQLPPDVELVAVQLPGRANRFDDAPVTRIEPLLAELETNLAIWLDRPFVLFGHSMGAVLAYMFACRLRGRLGVPQPRRLLISSANPPGGCRPPRVPDAPTDETLLEMMVQLGGTPGSILQDKSLTSVFLSTLRADLQLLNDIVVETPTRLDVPISAFCGAHDSAADPANMGRWANVTAGGFEMHMGPGGHFYWLLRPHAVLQRACAELR